MTNRTAIANATNLAGEQLLQTTGLILAAIELHAAALGDGAEKAQHQALAACLRSALSSAEETAAGVELLHKVALEACLPEPT